MITTLTIASLLFSTPSGHAVACPTAAPSGGDDTLQELYLAGRSFEEFLGDAVRRKELWHGNYGKGESMDMSLVERVRAVPGTWRFLAVAVDSCSDSVSTIPYLARLVELVDQLDMRVVDPTAGREIMESHRTPDGRPATPTVLLLDEDWNEVGCFIERPNSLQSWVLDNNERLSGDEIYEWKMDWYAENSGQETLEEFVAMLEAAAQGRTLCAR